MAIELLHRYNYMKIWGMSKGSCLFQAVSVIVGEKTLLGVLGYVQPRPDMREVTNNTITHSREYALGKAGSFVKCVSF